MKKHWVIIIFVTLVLCLSSMIYAFEIPNNGHDWKSLPKSERVAFCSTVISEKEGLGVYPSETVELATQYFAGRINYYYETYPLDNSILEAATWAWPEAKKMLDSLSSKDRKPSDKKKISLANKMLGSLGLLFDIIGAILVAIEVVKVFQGPLTIDEETARQQKGGRGRSLKVGTPFRHVINPDYAIYNTSKRAYMKCGLFFLVVGFAMQIISLWI